MANNMNPANQSAVFAARDPEELLYNLYNDLRVSEEQGDLDERGKKFIKLIENGSVIPDYVGSYLKGGTQNWSDEIAGYLTDAFGDTAKQIKQEFNIEDLSSREIQTGLERMKQETFAQENPILDPVLQIAGGLTTDYLINKGMKPKVTTIPATLAQRMGSGMKYGFASGLGESEGYGDPEQAMQDVAVTTGLSTAIGGAGSGVASGLKAAYKYGAKPIVNAIFKTPNKQADENARKIVKELIDMDVTDWEQAKQILAQNSDRQIQIADLGNNIRSAVDWALTIPTPTKKQAQDFLQKRTNGMKVRLSSDLQEQFGKKVQFFDTFNAHKVARKEMGEKLYNKAFTNKNSKITFDEELSKLFKRPVMREAISEAENVFRNKGIDFPKLTFNDAGEMLVNGQSVNAVDTELLHMVKVGLDDIIGKNKAPQSTIGNNLLGAYAETKNKLLKIIDSKNPTYKIARDQWADDSAVMNALKAGNELFSKEFLDNPTMVKQLLKTMSKSEKEAFRNGALNAIENTMGGVVTSGENVVNKNVARQFLTNDKKLKVLRETFNTEEGYNKFIKNLTTEMEMYETSALGKGSQTYGRGAIDKYVGESARVETSLPNMAANIVNKIFKNASEAEKKVTADKILQITTNKSPQEIALIMNEMSGLTSIDQINAFINKYGLKGLLNPLESDVVIGQQAGNQEYRLENLLKFRNPELKYPQLK